MSRDIKFRDFDCDTKSMRYFDLDHYDRETHDCFGNIMQYTGLNDKNGVPIYEGDIMLAGKHSDGKPFAITFKSGCFMALPFGTCESAAFYSKVIGDIYTTPELLKP